MSENQKFQEQRLQREAEDAERLRRLRQQQETADFFAETIARDAGRRDLQGFYQSRPEQPAADIPGVTRPEQPAAQAGELPAFQSREELNEILKRGVENAIDGKTPATPYSNVELMANLQELTEDDLD